MPSQKTTETDRARTKKPSRTSSGLASIQTAHAIQLKLLEEDFFAEFQPANFLERTLVDMLVTSEWRQRQWSRLEAGIWEANRIEGGGEDENSIGAIFFRAVKDLDRVNRGRERASKNFHSTLSLLLDIRAERKQAALDRNTVGEAAAKPPAGQPVKPSSGLFCVPKRS